MQVKNKWKWVEKEMPKYQIFEQCMVDVIYKIEAASKEEAQKIWEENHYDVSIDEDYNGLSCVGEGDYDPTTKIVIEEI